MAAANSKSACVFNLHQKQLLQMTGENILQPGWTQLYSSAITAMSRYVDVSQMNQTSRAGPLRVNMQHNKSWVRIYFEVQNQYTQTVTSSKSCTQPALKARTTLYVATSPCKPIQTQIA